MPDLRAIATAEHEGSIRAIAARYGVQSARALADAFTQTREVTYLGYTLTRSGTTIEIRSQNGEKIMTVEATDGQITPEQRDEAIEKTWNGIKEFLRNNWDHIVNGDISAADIGGAVYGIAATVIASIFLPIAGNGLLGKLLTAPFIALSANKGRYWGTAVDELIAIIRGDEATCAQIVGTLATALIINAYLPGAELFGGDAWSITRTIGNKLGGAASEGLDWISSAAGDVATGTVDIATSALDAIF